MTTGTSTTTSMRTVASVTTASMTASCGGRSERGPVGRSEKEPPPGLTADESGG